MKKIVFLSIILTISVLTASCSGRGADTPAATGEATITAAPDITREATPTPVTEGPPREIFISNLVPTDREGLYVIDKIPLSAGVLSADLVYRFDETIITVHQNDFYNGSIELRAYDRVDLHEINRRTCPFSEFASTYLLNEKYLVVSEEPDRRDEIEDSYRISVYDQKLNKIQEFVLPGFGYCGVRYYDEENERVIFFGGVYSSDDPGAIYSYECKTGRINMLFSADMAEVPEGWYVFSIVTIALTNEKDLWIGVDTAPEEYAIPSDNAKYLLDLKSLEVTKVQAREGMITYFDSDASAIYPYFEPNGKRITVGHTGFYDEGPQIEIYDENDDPVRTIKLSDPTEVINYLVDWKNNVIITMRDGESGYSEQEYRSYSMDTGELIARCVSKAGEYRYENNCVPDPEYGILIIPGLSDDASQENTDDSYVLYAWEYLGSK